MSLVGWAPSYAVLALLLTAAGVSSAAFHAVGSAAAGRLVGAAPGQGPEPLDGGRRARARPSGPVLAAAALTVPHHEGTGLS